MSAFTSVLTEEDYFVAPPGNIPLKLQKDRYSQPQSKETQSSAKAST
jgi:hypothetical protein